MSKDKAEKEAKEFIKEQEAKREKKKRKKSEVFVRDLKPKRDLFYVHKAHPDRAYYHAEEDPLRIRELELEGWIVCDGEEVVGSPLALSDDGTSRNLNLPGHVLMWTSKENKERLEREKDDRLRAHEEDVKDKVDQVKSILERSGLGRARARLKDEDIDF
jgi:hypothetical protein